MSKITFIGAGSTVFAKNVLGDVMMKASLDGFELALYDIDYERLRQTESLLRNLNRTIGSNCRIHAYTDRKEALRGARFVVDAIAVGGYDATMIDFEIPKKYGLRQTIADTVGIGGIFRALRTIPALEEIAGDIHEVCPDALFLNYTNPMAMLVTYLHTHAGLNVIGLCHSVQKCAKEILHALDMDIDPDTVQTKIAGINHMAWLLEIKHEGRDLYPEIKRLAKDKQKEPHKDMVRFEMMFRFGYYNTESSVHTAEYHPYFIKSKYPELIERFGIKLDDYPSRQLRKMELWKKQKEKLANNEQIEHSKSVEYASRIMEAVVTNRPLLINGNVMNTGGLISNLPREACVEVPCLIDANGVSPVHVGDLPMQLAALNRTNINMQLLTVQAAVTKKREYIYHAAYLDPHTAAELSMDDIAQMCDELIEAHGNLLPNFK